MVFFFNLAVLQCAFSVRLFTATSKCYGLYLGKRVGNHTVGLFLYFAVSRLGSAIVKGIGIVLVVVVLLALVGLL